jgi:nicotinate-nucleotide pyrophosphorylase (carboxylating)
VDVTSVATIPAAHRSVAAFVTRGEGVVAGVAVALAVMDAACGDALGDVEVVIDDGARVRPGDVIARVCGPTRLVLTAERSALNLLCHLSGVATLTRRWADALDGTPTTVRDTRKTTPGLRALEKYAVRCGGGFNHRFGLDDAMLIKDNHIAVAGGIRAVLERARAAAGHLVKIEIEVDTLDQLREVVAVGLADAALLDNMDAATMRAAVEMVAGRFPLEASGGITLDSIGEIAKTGVDYASSGWITHSAPNLDVALDIEI